MADDLIMRDDYLVWNNVTSVSYEAAEYRASIVDVPAVYDGLTGPPEPPPSTNLVYDIAVAKRRTWKGSEAAPSGGTIVNLDQKWIIPDVMFPAGVLSKPGDVVVEVTTGTSNEEQPGTRWTVLSVDPWGKNRWTRHLICRNLVVALQLADNITIERPKITYDAAGVPVKQFPSDADNPAGVVTYANLPARVQLDTKPETDEFQIRGSEGRYTVTLPYDINVTREDRIVLASGMYLDILDYQMAQRIDMLPRIEARRKV